MFYSINFHIKYDVVKHKKISSSNKILKNTATILLHAQRPAGSAQVAGAPRDQATLAARVDQEELQVVIFQRE